MCESVCIHVRQNFTCIYQFSGNLNRFLDFIFTYIFFKLPNLNKTFDLVNRSVKDN